MSFKDSLRQHFFWKYAVSEEGIFSESKTVLFQKINDVMRWTYLFFLFFTFARVFGNDNLIEAEMVNPLWPLAILKEIPLDSLMLFIKVTLLFCFLVLSYSPRIWTLRIISFLVFFFYVALENSFGKINHNLHLPLMLLFCYALMPSNKVASYEKKTLLIFASAQFFLLLAYSLTGFWKIFWGIIQFFKGEVSIFSPLSFRNILLEQFQSFNSTFLGDFFLEHYILGWLFYWLVIYVELCSVLVIFRPKLHKIWGVLILLFHASTALVLGVNMYASVISVGVLLIMSPFAKSVPLNVTIKQMPFVFEINSFLKRKH